MFVVDAVGPQGAFCSVENQISWVLDFQSFASFPLQRWLLVSQPMPYLIVLGETRHQIQHIREGDLKYPGPLLTLLRDEAKHISVSMCRSQYAGALNWRTMDLTLGSLALMSLNCISAK
jgi:hypothetical protein